MVAKRRTLSKPTEGRVRAGDGRRTAARRPGQPALPRNLPAELSSLIGRGQEIRALRRLLAATRLLTLTGSPGVGKTRLALRAASLVAAQYAHGVAWADLTPLTDPALVPTAVAAALEVREPPDRPLTEVLVELLRPLALLLVLDNCEHLVSACTGLAVAILTACPDVRILVSSRQPLGLAGEVTWRVPSLTVPVPAEPPKTLAQSTVLDSAAGRLFVERAVAARATFALTDQNAVAVAEICQRLDGIPLAIELAAAWVRVLTAEQIASRLHDRFRLLTGGGAAVLPRHRTLAELVDWSYALLAEPERALLRRLAVFSGGWTLDAAEAIGAGGIVLPEAVLELLARLVDQSLVTIDEQGGQARYRLLESVRAYAAERLAQAGELATTHRRHRDWFMALAERAEPGLYGPEQAAWLDRLEAEHANARAALSWSWDNGDPEPGLRLAAALLRFWDLRGHISEGRAWLADLLELPTVPGQDAARARALNSAGFLAFTQNDYTIQYQLQSQALILGRQLESDLDIGWALTGLGACAALSGQAERATELLESSLAAWRRVQWQTGLSMSLNLLGWLAHAQDEQERAQDLFEQSLAAARTSGDLWGSTHPLDSLARLAWMQGSYVRATELQVANLRMRRDLRDTRGITYCIEGLAWLASKQDQPERAARLFGAAAALHQRVGSVEPAGWVGWRTEHNQAEALARATLGDVTYSAAWQIGHGMEREAVIAYALSTEQLALRPAPTAAKPLSARGLTRRELEVAALVAQGLTNRQIATELVISERTAANHIQHILEKLGFRTRGQVTAWALTGGA
jgi:predicted ATPase/DNA-binding CsgD family transcriptional regulator